MHTLLITPFPLQGAGLGNALRRQNIQTLICSPKSLSYHWTPETDAVVFPHPLSLQDWAKLETFLDELPQYVPLILMEKFSREFWSERTFKKHSKQSIFLDHGLAFNESAVLIHEIIAKNSLNEAEKEFQIGKMSLNKERRVLNHQGKSWVLTKKEFFLLELFIRNAGRITTRESIMEYVWDKRNFVSQNTIDVYVSRLRKKLKKSSKESLIKTIPCLGYEFNL